MDERYKLAFDEAKRAITYQNENLANLRSRATALLSTSAVLATIASTLGLISKDASGNTVMDTWIALSVVVLVIGIGACAMIILVPTSGWIFTLNAKVLINGWIEGEPSASTDEMHKFLALAMTGHEERNRLKLNHLYRAFQIGAILLIVETLLLVVGFTVFG
jgi:hypothetical protein